MKIFRSAFDALPESGSLAVASVVAIGNFDGVHQGHREILRRVRTLALERELVPAVLTFDPHPARVLAPERAPKLIMTMDQRLRALAGEGIESVLVIPFSLDFARLTPEEFARDILAGRLGARVVMVGEDFRFGHRQSGNIATLGELGARFGFEVAPVEAIERRGERISSTGIRTLVTAGAVSRACRLLGTPFALEGAVVPGHGIGSRQTVPTLNLAPRNELWPGHGVYVTRTRDLASGRTWNSVTNVGLRPTFGGDSVTVETFLLGSLEGNSPVEIEVEFLSFVRAEKRFESAEELKLQIGKDVAVALRLHSRLAIVR